MTERNPNDKGPLAPRRPLTGPAGSQSGGRAPARPSSSGNADTTQQAMPLPPPPPPPSGGASAQQTTMAIPTVTDEPARPPQGPQARSGRTAPGRRPVPGGGVDTLDTEARERQAAQQAAAQQAAQQAAEQAAQRAQQSPPESEPTPEPTKRPVRTRKARLKVTRIDPWSVMKIAFALAIVTAIVTVVAVAIVWSVLEAAGVWEAINTSVGTVLSEDQSSSFDITDYVGMSRVLGLTAIVAAANVVLLTAIATLGAFLYNLAASLLGGLEITLAEDVR